MGRLTTDETYCQFIGCDADAEGCACDCTECRMYKRLQAYEQTGLEPDEIKTVQMLNRSYQYTLGGMSIPEFLELVEAKKEDRLIVLPAKLGDRVYTVAFENCWGGKCCWLKDGKCVKAGELDYCPQEVIEKTGMTDLKLCSKCGKIAGYNSWFKAYYCTACGELFGGDGK